MEFPPSSRLGPGFTEDGGIVAVGVWWAWISFCIDPFNRRAVFLALSFI